MQLTRINQLGHTYTLTDVGDGKTRITFRNESILVNLPLEELNQCWFMWQQYGKFIQDAFPKLSPDEREFILTGITPTEWDSLFGEDE